MIRNLVFTMSITGLAMGLANAQVRISEVMVNPPGSPDAGREFVELQSSHPHYPLDSIWVLGIDGDGEFNPGNIHWAVNLSGLSTGSNGLILIRDGAAVLQPAPSSQTTVYVLNNAFTQASMGNDSYTVAVVCGFRGQPGMDIDLNDDGIIDNVLWDRAIDAIGWLDGNDQFPGIADRVYATSLNGLEVPISVRIVNNDIWEPDAYAWFGGNNWLVADFTRCSGADNFGPYCISQTQRVLNGTMPEGFGTLTPGNMNPGKTMPVEGDVNSNGCTDDSDLLAVLFAFGEQGCASPADLNNDGVVDDSDLLIVLFNFGNGC
jgi:hypothetical protein